jgi:hypothetical protein
MTALIPADGMSGAPWGRRSRIIRSTASALVIGSWKRLIPASLQAIAQKPADVSKT